MSSLITLLDNLIATWENEVIEFKLADNSYKTDDIGEYFSALSNEARLHNQDSAWLVFGVDNKLKKIVGTNYRRQHQENLNLHKLKTQIQQNTIPAITFRNIHELDYHGMRVILFEIPAAPQNMPVAWKGHYYGRAGESLCPLGLDKLDLLRHTTFDWSAQIVPNATIDDLDSEALKLAKALFTQKHANRLSNEEINQWDTKTFLDKAKITQNGRITRTALLLLGKSESSFLLSPHPLQITWKLSTKKESAYEHFSIPFLLTTSQLYQKIRNFQIRLLPQDSLIAKEVAKYDQKIVLEALHNCIAHQDYSLNARIIVTEESDKLIFENEGNFFDGNPSDYIEGKKTPKRYRNPFLTQAMVQLSMIDTMGYGIYDMHKKQAQRYLPLPDYLLGDHSVQLTLYGEVVDESYTKLLINKTDLVLTDILALDRVQKKLPIEDNSAKHLKKAGLIKGRKPKYFVSPSIQSVYPNKEKIHYIRTKSQDDAFCTKLITDYLKEFKQADRSTINALLFPHLGQELNSLEKERKINNLLTKLRRNKVIINNRNGSKSSWFLL